MKRKRLKRRTTDPRKVERRRVVLAMQTEYREANWDCEYCRLLSPVHPDGPPGDPLQHQLEHIIPGMSGGTKPEFVGNYLMSCYLCHNVKHRLGPAGKVVGLWIKWQKGELDVPATEAAMGKSLIGWLSILEFSDGRLEGCRCCLLYRLTSENPVP